VSHDTLSPLGQEIAGALASFDEKIAGATGEDLQQRIDAAACRVRHYVVTGKPTLAPMPSESRAIKNWLNPGWYKPPTLWQRIARWWANKTR
jgi:hypothetical protein